eukprot:TRINITY_DN11851_c0_g1_i1.p1 TRINITY_DN11851_c0_g1~~TRINITY_DN11851_c0_g1_i1.p1  ORF type:complete len:132 (+),score=12.47 TRINITY_DN11851_c0_g1_i1:390-785(+)
MNQIKPERVHVLYTISELSLMKGMEEYDDLVLPCTRILRTSFAKEVPLPEDCPFLESPVIVEGLPAAILTHCQLYKIPAVCYLSVENHTLLHEETLIGFEHVLSQIVGTRMHSDYSQFLSRRLCPSNRLFT